MSEHLTDVDQLVERLRWKWADHGVGYNSEYTADLIAAADALVHLQDRLAKAAHEREPPHCSTCSCGMPTETTGDGAK